ncbi:hypothetical protein BD410DRAFT_840370 [Rickenella mellea]|uniref:Uncharacterized protein n=1 Tax=Rickenella mellea TaxID=50990 RepID=A0A4Y7Q340_9AGAM|nr:hypothetical protein BD410DRAFT_840370 [Rickenella mellea]
MAKSKGQPSSSQSSANRKLTDFFSRKPGSSSSAPSSSQPQPLSSSPAKSASGSGKSVGGVKMEQQEVISISSSSSGCDSHSPSVISISSTSVISISSTAPSSPALVPIAITTRAATAANNKKMGGQKPKPRGRQFLEAVELKSPPPRRRSPRLNGGPTQFKVEKREVTLPPKNPATPKKNRKRKNDFDDDTSEYNTSGDVIVVSSYRSQSKVSTKALASTTSPNKKLKTESPIETPCLSLSSKSSLAIPTQAEVIPSSQSDELEVEVQTTNASGARRSETSVESWLSQSQGDVDPNAGDMDNMDNMNMDVQMDVEELLASPNVNNPSLSLSPSRTSSLTSLSSRQSSPSPSTPAPSLLTTPPPPSAGRPPPSEKTPTSHATPKSASRPHKPTSTPTPGAQSTPSALDPLKLATPTKLDEASKTAAFIAAIRERAFAASPPSRSPPDDEMAELKALSSDSDDSGLESDSGVVFFGGVVAKKGKGHNATSRSAVSPVTASSSTLASTSTSMSTSMAGGSRSTASSSVPPPTRELRASRRSAARDSTGSNATTRTPPGKRPQFLAHALSNGNSSKASSGTRTTSKWGEESSAAAQKRKMQKKKADPFASLLSEKRKAEKLGTAGLEMRLKDREEAEKALAIGARLGLGDDSDEDYQDLGMASLSSQPSGSEVLREGDGGDGAGVGMGDEVEVEVETVRLFGREEGKAVGKIIARDRLRRDDESEEVPGVALWEAVNNDIDIDMDVDGGVQRDDAAIIPPLDLDAEGMGRSGPVMELLRKYVEKQDINAVTLLLQSGALTDTSIKWTTPLVSWLFALAASPDGRLDAASGAAFRALENYTTSSPPRTSEAADFLPLDALLGAMLVMGGNTDVLKALGNGNCPTIRRGRGHIDSANRANALYRLVAIVDAFACAKMVKSDEVSQFIAALLMIAQDSTTDDDTKRDIIRAVESLCTASCTFDENTRDPAEVTICSQIVRMSEGYSVTNNAHLISFIPGCSPLVRRIAQWVGFEMLGCDTAAASIKSRNPTLPPLTSIIIRLSGAGEDEPGPFDIRRGSNGEDETDYKSLAGNADILDSVMTNITPYVQQERERQEEAVRQSQSEGREGNSAGMSPARKVAAKDVKQSELEIIENLLQGLGGKIVDTRGVHLDRSRAKAAIQRLFMRIHYQRLSTSGLGSGSEVGVNGEVRRPKPKKLDDWFKSPTARASSSKVGGAGEDVFS